MKMAGKVIVTLFMAGFALCGQASAEDVAAVNSAINQIQNAMVEKLAAIESLDVMLTDEQAVCDTLEQMLTDKDYGGLTKNDVAKAQREMEAVMRKQGRAKGLLEKCVAEMQGTLSTLGWQAPTPVGHWALDDGTGNTAEDSAGTNDGVIHDANWTTGWLDGALEFDGYDDYVQIGPGVLPVGEKSIFAWIKMPPVGQGSGNPYDYLIYYGICEPGYVILYFNDGVELRWRDYNLGFDAKYTVALDDDKWHFVGATYNGAVHRLYFDGEQVGTSVGSDHLPITAEEGIGGFSDSLHRNFLGSIDDVRIYNTYLTTTEIQLLYYNELD